jgi:NAD(P)-dependent dehydrogenase (short-subunit alcohol dehydrogenase family)
MEGMTDGFGKAAVLAGRIALVTGASRGIGAAVARALAAAGARVVLAARDGAGLAHQVEAIAGAGGAALAVPADVTSEASVDALFDRIRSEFGRLDAAVNNAGGGGRPPARLAEWTSDEFDSSLAVNLRGVFLCLRRELPLMAATGGGAIVNVSSTAGEQGVAGLGGYVASKYGVGGLTRVAALDYAADGVRVNAVAPGPILTERLAAAGEAAQRLAGAAVPLGRIGVADEVAQAVLWLVSDSASFVTGSVLPIDGGRLAGVPAFAMAAGRRAGA